jgi:hypothetical protein
MQSLRDLEAARVGRGLLGVKRGRSASISALAKSVKIIGNYRKRASADAGSMQLSPALTPRSGLGQKSVYSDKRFRQTATLHTYWRYASSHRRPMYSV